MAFEIPITRIRTQADLDVFTKSSTYESLFAFITSLNQAVHGVPNSKVPSPAPVIVSKLDRMLDQISHLIDVTPAVDNAKSRFGNPAFQQFFDLLESRLLGPANQVQDQDQGSLLQDLNLPDGSQPEIATYLLNSFGNRTRIDYGSGHELNFVCFLYCLSRFSILRPANDDDDDDDPVADSVLLANVVLIVFNKYMAIMRKLQTAYWLEPAGSHGVWGLDDYHFLPFMFGSSQLATHKHLRPRSIHDSDIVDMYASEYMYLTAIQFINSVKTASLRWSSPMLDDISGVKTWQKVNEGMIKMYKAEVLAKVPIMQHFLFGSILAIVGGNLPSETEPASASTADDDTNQAAFIHAGHVHADGVWGDCCGIKVPSAIAASKTTATGTLRSVNPLIPFD
ncbi:Phosphotyrosyl phosphatase activator [Lipomyces japonicus]|uniref:Phosphotyrosyl phosphatase activator n=1 Tax=Lipomyces japonicus TaxID=56871 RepID=UPI0034CEB442